MAQATLSEALIDDRPDAGVFRVHRRIFSDQAVFDLEMKHLFESGWVFLGVESQAPNPHDYFSTQVGRQPIVVMRDGEGQLGAFLNSCPHRGARLCNLDAGNKKLHVCPYHSWSFSSDGRNRAIKGKQLGMYTEEFLAANHDMIRIGAFGNYRGLLFGSLTADVPTLEEYLGEARKCIDLMVDQSPEGFELVPGTVSFTYDANWKMQLENCSDSYHLTSVHGSYFRVSKDRAASAAAASKANDATEVVWDRVKTMAEDSENNPNTAPPTGAKGGGICFENGHILNWVEAPVTAGHALYERNEELEKRVGPKRRDWMFYVRNLTLFPNVQLAENFASQLRIIRPIAPDKTEMLTYCLAPKGESAAARTLRIRHYEDFFSPSGMATPDDASIYEDCQGGQSYPEGDGWLQGYSRGITGVKTGPSSFIEELQIQPAFAVEGVSESANEVGFHAYYRAWRKRIDAALAKAAAR